MDRRESRSKSPVLHYIKGIAGKKWNFVLNKSHVETSNLIIYKIYLQIYQIINGCRQNFAKVCFCLWVFWVFQYLFSFYHYKKNEKNASEKNWNAHIESVSYLWYSETQNKFTCIILISFEFTWSIYIVCFLVCFWFFFYFNLKHQFYTSKLNVLTNCVFAL